MRVLVTGANGLLGHHVVFRLLEMNYQVTIIVRNSRNIHFDLNKVRVCDGNFTDYETLKAASAGCDAIVHIAAVTATELLHYEDYSETNVGASALILQVASELDIKRLVFVSTANTIGFGARHKPADERHEIQFPFSESFYARSKVEAEQLFIDASLLPERHVVIINPSFLIGAYDTKPSSGKLMLMGYKKALMFIPRGGKNFVAASDVATAVSNAVTMGNNGERYLATGVNLSFRRFYRIQKKLGHYRQFLILIPDFILLLAGKAGNVLRKKGIKTEVSTMNLRQLIIRENYTNEKARNELNMPETPIENAITEALDWFKKTGKIN